MVNRKIPKIRFRHFSDDWKSDKLGKLGTVAMNKRIFKEETSEVGEIPFYKIGSFGREPDSFITREKFEEYKSKYPYPEIGDILISASGSIGRTVEYLGEEAYFQDSNIVWLKHDERLDNSFLKQFYSIVKWQGIEGTTIKRLYNKNILETSIALPSISEQSAIGSLFRTFDDLLASYKDNLANYQSLKATMLSKMFPKAGQTVPEIRLDGFEGEWEINKLNKYLTVSKQKNTQLKFDKEDVLSVSGEFGIINQIQFQGRSFAGASVEMYSIVDTGNIVYTKSPLKANPYGIIKTNYGIPGIVSTLYAVYLPNENVFPGFVERYFENDLRLNSYLKPLVNKGAKNDMKVSDENALLGAVIFPQLEEQVAISDYFTNLDKFIQSHKDKITQLEILKKKLLQNMFI